MRVPTPGFVLVVEDGEDLLAVRAARALHLAGAIRILCVVANRMVDDRSLTKGVLEGLEGVPVGAGSDRGDRQRGHGLDDWFAVSPDAADGYELLKSVLGSASDGVHMVVTSRSRSTDVSRLLYTEPHLFENGVEHVTIPDNAYRELGLFLGQLSVSTDVLPSATTNAYTLPVEIFREMHRWGNEIARWLVERTLSEWTYPAGGVPLPDLAAFLVALSFTRRVPIDDGSPLRDLLRRGLLDPDPATRRRAMETIAIAETHRAAQEMRIELPPAIGASVDEDHGTVGVVYERPIATHLAPRAGRRAYGTLQRWFPGRVNRVTLEPIQR